MWRSLNENFSFFRSAILHRPDAYFKVAGATLRVV